MKGMNLLVWMTQLGLSLVVPLTCFVLLGVWLHYSLGWSKWVLIGCILLGIYSGLTSLWSAVKIMTRMEKPPPQKDIPTSFNDHA